MMYGCSSRYFLPSVKTHTPMYRLSKNSHQSSDPSCPPQSAVSRKMVAMPRSE